MTVRGQGSKSDSNGRHSAPKRYAWLASGIIVLQLIAAQLLPRGDQPILRAAGVFVLLVTSVFIFGPFYLLNRYGRSMEGASYLQSSKVVNRGLYAVVRHPQYLGYILLASGFALISSHWIAVLLALIASACFYLQAVEEEAFCLAQFGESYQRYLQRVPRFNVVLGVIRILRRRGRG